MNVNEPTDQDCKPGYKLLGDFWVLRIVGVLKNGEMRFCQIERELAGVNTATLAKRLASLHEEGLVSRNEISRADVVYSLTAQGKLVLPVLEAMDDFSAKYNKLHSK